MARLLQRYFGLVGFFLVLCYTTMNLTNLREFKRQPIVEVFEKSTRGKRSIEKTMSPLLATRRKPLKVFDEVDFSNFSDGYLEMVLRNSLLDGHFDDRGKYKNYANVFMADKYLELSKEAACVATHSTVDPIRKIFQFIKNWKGMISLALFAPSYEYFIAIVYIKHLRMCYPSMRDQISWHLSLPNEIPPPVKYLHFLRREFNCSVTGVQISKMLNAEVSDEDKKELKNLRYPQNAMRNLARRHCKNEWVLCPDVDMVFPDTLPHTESMHSKLNRFLNSDKARNCEKCAFVFPIYEIEYFKGRVPENKAVLLEYLSQQKAQIYHITIFEPNQRSSNLSVWEKLPLLDDVDIALPVDYHFYYEPVYVTRQGSPKFDERYIGYGMTRNTQALEMHLNGYRFFVLDSIFLSHLWGILENKPLEHSAPRKRQLQLNIKLFYTFFIRELALKYQINMDSEVIAKTGRRPTKFAAFLPKVNIIYAANER